jgi:hypothetical protein
MMRALHVEAELAGYLEGTLGGAEVKRVAEHLLGCARCRRARDAVREGMRLVTLLGGRAVAPPSWAELAPRLDSSHRRRGVWWRGSLRPALLAAAALLVAGWAWWRRPHVTLERAGGTLSELERGALLAHQSGRRDTTLSQNGELREWIARRAHLDVWLGPVPPQLPFDGAQLLAEPAGAVAVAYRAAGAPVTLVVAKAASLAGDPPPLGRIYKRMRIRRQGPLTVVSWTRKDLAYALVSDLDGLPAPACFLCHHDPARQAFIASLEVPR